MPTKTKGHLPVPRRNSQAGADARKKQIEADQHAPTVRELRKQPNTAKAPAPPRTKTRPAEETGPIGRDNLA